MKETRVTPGPSEYTAGVLTTHIRSEMIRGQQNIALILCTPCKGCVKMSDRVLPPAKLAYGLFQMNDSIHWIQSNDLNVPCHCCTKTKGLLRLIVCCRKLQLFVHTFALTTEDHVNRADSCLHITYSLHFP